MKFKQMHEENRTECFNTKRFSESLRSNRYCHHYQFCCYTVYNNVEYSLTLNLQVVSLFASFQSGSSMFVTKTQREKKSNFSVPHQHFYQNFFLQHSSKSQPVLIRRKSCLFFFQKKNHGSHNLSQKIVQHRLILILHRLIFPHPQSCLHCLLL